MSIHAQLDHVLANIMLTLEVTGGFLSQWNGVALHGAREQESVAVSGVLSGLRRAESLARPYSPPASFDPHNPIQ